MSKGLLSVLSPIIVFFLLIGTVPAQTQSSDAKALLEAAAKAMGGIQALRSLKNQVVESEGKQFDSSSTPRPGGATRQITSFRYTLTRDVTQPRVKLEWDGQSLGRNEAVRWIEVIDGSVGLLQERGPGSGGKQSRLHPARLATRLREEKRSAARIILVALEEKSLTRLADAEMDGIRHHVLAFKDNGNEFRLYLDPKTKLPAEVEIMEDEPTRGRQQVYSALWRLAQSRWFDAPLQPTL